MADWFRDGDRFVERGVAEALGVGCGRPASVEQP